MNYEQDVEIDENALDIEWLDQASLAIKYGRNWAECKQKFTQAEEKIKLVRSELMRDVNDDPDGCLGDGVKPTGPNIESYYRNHKNHIAAKDEWVKLGFEMNVAEIAYKEISYARKAALENLVKLHGQQYFAGPTVPRDIAEERQMKQNKVNSGIKSRMTRTKNQ